MSSGITGDVKIADRERGIRDLGVPGELSFGEVLTRRESRAVEAVSSGRVEDSQLYHQWGASPSLYGVPNVAYLAESVCQWEVSGQLLYIVNESRLEHDPQA